MRMLMTIVATAVGEIPIALDDGRAGVLVPPADAGVLATALAGVLSDPARARAMGGIAAQRAAEQYTFAGMMERYVALYGALLQRGPASRTARNPRRLSSNAPVF